VKKQTTPLTLKCNLRSQQSQRRSNRFLSAPQAFNHSPLCVVFPYTAALIAPGVKLHFDLIYKCLYTEKN